MNAFFENEEVINQSFRMHSKMCKSHQIYDACHYLQIFFSLARCFGDTHRLICKYLNSFVYVLVTNYQFFRSEYVV